MKIYFPKVSLGFVQPRKPKSSINPFSTKKVTLRVPVLKLPNIKVRNPFTKA